MKYKVGDKVRIKSLDWYNENATSDFGDIDCGAMPFMNDMIEYCNKIVTISNVNYKDEYYEIEEDVAANGWTDDMIERLVEETKRLGQEVGEKIGEVIVDYLDNKEQNKGEISDGYHTFNELYEYRKLYNAALFNEWSKNGLYDVHKSKLHSDGTIPFGDSNLFIVMAELPTGQISNHYEIKDWDLFHIPEKEKANKYDGHSPNDVTYRLNAFLKL